MRLCRLLLRTALAGAFDSNNANDYKEKQDYADYDTEGHYIHPSSFFFLFFFLSFCSLVVPKEESDDSSTPKKK